jgi:hypothetical protein
MGQLKQVCQSATGLNSASYFIWRCSHEDGGRSRLRLSGPRAGRWPCRLRRVLGRDLRAGAADALVGSRWAIECRHLEARE